MSALCRAARVMPVLRLRVVEAELDAVFGAGGGPSLPYDSLIWWQCLHASQKAGDQELAAGRVNRSEHWVPPVQSCSWRSKDTLPNSRAQVP